MIKDDELRRLADADPARAVDPEAPDELLDRLLAEPRPAPEGTRLRGRRIVSPLVALAVAAAVVIVVLVEPFSSSRTGLSGGSLALAAQAYALTSVAPHEIVHTLATFDDDIGGTPDHGTIEEWHRGRETHRIEKYYAPGGTLTAALDHVITADGVMYQVDENGSYRIVRTTDNQDAANVIAEQQSGFIDEFRRHYQRGELDPAGITQFAGRPAQRYVVSAEQNTPPVIEGGRTLPAPANFPPGPQIDYYIDRDTGQPLGYTSTLTLGPSSGQGGPGPPARRFVETVQTIQQLPPTPENLAKLHTLSLPRRRDADGCIRGPVTSAHQSDTAPKTDCGGTPGAIVPGTAP